MRTLPSIRLSSPDWVMCHYRIMSRRDLGLVCVSMHDTIKVLITAPKKNSESCLTLPLECLKLLKVPVFISLTVPCAIIRTIIVLSNAKWR